MKYLHTRWRRNRDDVVITIVADSEAGFDRTNRSLLARNVETRRNFWITPEGLWKKYEQITDTSDEEVFAIRDDDGGLVINRDGDEFEFYIDFDDMPAVAYLLDEVETTYLMSSLFEHLTNDAQSSFLSLIGER
ncbi:hypothetical protein SEA_MOLLYMUR_50 [Gordonia phage Mollymur]|uniref:Uncharacterized protein n=1 Tax=Gordonia phage Mollymur TaxID=2590895 RepID=A0A4Y6E9Q7_9CAUD|nr:hypothetical protein PQB84_gp075 [Gordonia phage Mollymur]QDF15411.1 hypothetical protein SEA_MOLLYMUR_50 [Gordonia phage Mollymur]